jgi:Ca2+-binding RTX toxin-like protein
MAYISTYDEKYTGFYSSYASAYIDAPASTSTNFAIAEGVFYSAYGLLGTDGYYADTDTYSMGSLNPGTYSVSASNGYWFFGSGYSNYVNPKVTVYNGSGNYIAGGSLSSASFSVTATDTYYIAVTGSNYWSSQYSVYYTYTPPANYAASSGTLAIEGSLTYGSTLSLTGSWSDKNGLSTANSTAGYAYSWYTSSDKITWTPVSAAGNSSYQITNEDLGKYIDCLITFKDDAGYSESVSPLAVFVPAKIADKTPPNLTSINPIDGAMDVAVGANFVLSFNESVKAGTGNFVIKNGKNTIASIAVTDTSQVSFSGSKITINPTSNLSYSTKYSVSVGTGVIKDAAGNNWVGTSADPYNFTTANKIFNGTNGNDTLNGTYGDDLIYGGSGNDILNGRAGADLMWGGAGNDIYYVDNASDQTNEAVSASNAADAGGTDLVYSTVSRALGSYLENLTLVGKSPISGTGNGLNNRITGNLSMNTLAGGLGIDSLYGGADKVKDVFDFNAIAESKTGTTRDKVYDFVTKVDKIDLSGIDANNAKTRAGDQAFTFNGATAKANSVWCKAADVDGDKKVNDVIVFGDVNGDVKVDFEIGLVGVTAIAAGDFVL